MANNNNNKNNGKKPSLLKALLIYVVIFIVVADIITIISGGSLFGGGDARSIEFSELVDYLEKGQVTEVLINENNRGYTAKLKSGETVIAYAPTVFEMQTISEKYIVPQSTSGTLVVKSVKPSNYSSFISWIPTLIMIIFMVILAVPMYVAKGEEYQTDISYSIDDVESVKETSSEEKKAN